MGRYDSGRGYIMLSVVVEWVEGLEKVESWRWLDGITCMYKNDKIKLI